MNWPKVLIDDANKIINQLDFNITTPQKSDVLNFMNIKPKDIKVVFIGQDPYPTKNVANGYAFAVKKNEKIPASLKNIFKEMKNTINDIHTDRTLQSWVDQGVLLLNTSLTTKIGKPNAHSHLWKKYSMKVIEYLSSNFDITWVLWGNNAHGLKKEIVKGNIITDAHPSPLSFYRRKGNTFIELKKLCDIIW